MERLYFIDNHLLNPIVRRQWVDHFTNVVKLLANEFEVVPVMWPISLFFYRDEDVERRTSEVKRLE